MNIINKPADEYTMDERLYLQKQAKRNRLTVLEADACNRILSQNFNLLKSLSVNN